MKYPTRATRRLSLSGMAVSAIALTLPAAALAERATDLTPVAVDAALTGENTDILVTAAREGYTVGNTSSGTKTDTPIIDVPQSISVLTAQQIEDQAIRSMGDLVRMVPGVSPGQGEGNRDQITLRGNNSTADFFTDGLRDDVQQYRSFYNVERVEVLKGSNAMIFGRGGGGGVVNRILKSPDASGQFGQLNGSIDSFGAWFGTLDFNAPIGESAAFRINGQYEELNNHRRTFEGHRWAVNPTLAFTLGNSRFLIGYEHVEDQRNVDRGVPSLNNRPLDGFDKTFFGVIADNHTRFNGDALRARSIHELSQSLTLSTSFLYGDYDKYYTNVFPTSAVRTVAGARQLDVQAYQDFTDRETLIGQANLTWRTSLGGMEHVLLIGIEGTRQDGGVERINGYFGAVGTGAANRTQSVNLTDPMVIPASRFVAGHTGNSNRAVSVALDQFSLYAQDQISLTEQLQLIAGLRYDRFSLDVGNLFTGAHYGRTDELWSPRVGLVFKPDENSSLYASWSRSYLPQSGDQFSALDATLATLEPEKFDNYEVGAKWDVTPSLFLTAAAYVLERSNSRATGPVPGTILLTGRQRTKGAELAVTGRILPHWQISAGYGYTDAQVVDGDTAGRRVGQAPRHSASLWNRYEATDQLGIGLGVVHQSRYYANISNTVIVPAFTRVDAAVFLRLADNVDAQLNVENLLGADYYASAHSDHNIMPGAPTNVRLTVKFSF